MKLDHNCVLVGWNASIPGHERGAMAAFSETHALYAKAQAAGQLASYETVLLNRHGGDLNGFTLLRGDHEKLHAFIHGEEFLTALMKAEMHVSGLGVIEGWSGERVGDMMGLWAKVAGI
jgi:hypothetical protein